jgi:hypothetical protein
MKICLYTLALIVAFVLFAESRVVAQTGPQGITLEGNIITASNLPEEASSVSFTIQIKSPGVENCVLYQESQTLNMTNSGGVFALSIGAGVRPGSGYEATSSLKSAFKNAGGTISGLTCASGSSFTPAASDKRVVMITFDDGSGAQSITQALDVQTVPYAMYADTLQGKTPTDLIQVNTTTAQVSQANLESVFDTLANITKLQNLIAGTSSDYAKNTVASGAKIPVYNGAPASPIAGSVWLDSSSGKLSYYDGASTQALGTSGGSVTSVTAGSGLSGGTITTSGTISMPGVGTVGTYTKVTTDAQGRVSSGTTLVAADIPTLDAAKIASGVLSSAQIPSGTDATKLPLAGGTMSGAIDMGSQNITNAGYLTQAAGKYLGLGSYTDAAETTLVTGTLTPGGNSFKGATWFNSDSNVIRYWNGTSTVAIATGSTAISTLNGLATATQLFANGASGTAPAFVSSGSTHTLNIPLAATALTTAGLLSNTDYAQIIRKDGTVAFTADQSLGSHKLTNVTDPASAQDAATRNYADTHAAGKNVAAAVATAVTGATGNGFVLTWDQAGTQWTAAAPASSGTVTSVGLSLPAMFTVTNSPVTTTGTLTGTLATQTANTIFAGPASGVPATPTFRAIASADLPTISVAKGGTGSTSLTPNGLLMADGTGSTVTSPVCGSGMGYISDGTSFSCTAISSAANTFINGGNSFGGNATLGTNDNNTLGLKTNGSIQMTINATGSVGIGTTNPNNLLNLVKSDSSPILEIDNNSSSAQRYPGINIANWGGNSRKSATEFIFDSREQHDIKSFGRCRYPWLH